MGHSPRIRIPTRESFSRPFRVARARPKGYPFSASPGFRDKTGHTLKIAKIPRCQNGSMFEDDRGDA